jgi:putative transposase
VAAVIDLFSRRVVGWSMTAAMTAQLVTDNLGMAVWRRGNPMRCCTARSAEANTPAGPAVDGGPRCRLLNWAVQVTSGTMRRWKASFLSLKTERTARQMYRTRNQANADVFDYIERFYNRETQASTIA